MALHLSTVLSCQRFSTYKQPRVYLPKQPSLQSQRFNKGLQAASIDVSLVERPTVNFKPTSWSYDFVKSLDSHYSDKVHSDKLKELEVGARLVIEDERQSPLELLELIDDIERLGLGYRFQEDILRALDKFVSRMKGLDDQEEADLNSVYATALRFRVLRQHGYEVSEGMFRRFKDNKDGFIVKDVKESLSLYEASFLAFEGEALLDEAKSFTTTHLMENLALGQISSTLMKHINHALELPLHRRMQRVEARWYIDAYSKRKDANECLLELAILDYNVVQAVFQIDLQDASRWWKHTGLASRLSFVRDRLMEGFFWTVGVVFEPQYSACRVGLTKAVAFITSIDDVYDVYGSLDELEQFTDAVQRWDINAVESLPDYMKLCFLSLYNTVNEMAYDTLREQGGNVIPIFRKVWAELCNAFLIEARWNQKKHSPTLEDYLDNGWRSVSGMVILVHAFFSMNEEIVTEEAPLDYLLRNRDLLKWSSMIFRLCNDLATSSAELERGETANSIACYMRESGVSEELAREHIRSLIDEAWKKLNQSTQVANSPFSAAAINLARLVHCLYEYGDGHGDPDSRFKNRVSSVIVEPINLHI